MTDRAFWKSFSGLIAALVALTIVLFILAQIVGGKPAKVEATADAKAVAERIKPVGEVTVGAIPADKVAATPSKRVMDAIIPSANAASGDEKGKSIYDSSCKVCHAAGVAGAPKLTDKANWAPRLAQGNETLYNHAIKGFQGKVGMMPPKGGNMNLKDEEVKSAVDYMIIQSK